MRFCSVMRVRRWVQRSFRETLVNRQHTDRDFFLSLSNDQRWRDAEKGHTLFFRFAENRSNLDFTPIGSGPYQESVKSASIIVEPF